MTRAEIIKQFPGAVDYQMADISIMHTGAGYYARFDEKLDFYFGQYNSLSVVKTESMKYQILMAA